MKPLPALLVLVAGVVIGGVLLQFLRPASAAASNATLVGGRYLVVEGPDGHWIYEPTPGGLSVLAKEVSPAGLGAIWQVQGDYQPAALDLGEQHLLTVPNTMYSTVNGAFNVVHKFYRLAPEGLVEVPIQDQPQAPSGTAGR